MVAAVIIKFLLPLESGLGCYGEDLGSSDGSPKLISRETLKNISRELDQFKG